MCTATWIRTETGHELLFNRDERLTRAEAAPPRVHRAPGKAGDPSALRWIAPVDGDFGGSWISVNEAGLTLALLNGRWSGSTEPAGVRSRGLLVTDLASAACLADLEERLDAAPLGHTRAFRLIAVAPGDRVHFFEWDRQRLAVDRAADDRLPVVSSPFEESKVAEARRAVYARIAGGITTGPASPTLESLLAFHRQTDGAPSAYTVAMRRPDAATRSFTRVTVATDEVVMRYAVGLPRPEAPESVQRLPRLPRLPQPARSARTPVPSDLPDPGVPREGDRSCES